MEDKLGHKDCKNSSIQSFIDYYLPKECQHDNDLTDANDVTDVVNNDIDDAEGMHSGRIGLYCPACGSEWISPKFMTLGNASDNDSLMIKGERYYLLSNKMYCDPNFRMPTESEDVEISKIRRGDHIFYNFMAGSMIHHAIVENAKSGDGGLRTFTLIHWRKKGLGKFELVHEINIDLQTKGPLKRRKYSSDYVGAENAELTLARASAMLNHLKYNLIKRNCEHLATFCKIGAFYSWQTWFALRMATNIAACAFEETAKVAFVKTCANMIATKAASIAGKRATVAAAGADLAGNTAEGMVTLSNGLQFVAALTQAIGLGIVVVCQVGQGVFNVALLNKDMKNGKLSKQKFKKKVFEEAISTFERIFFTGVLPFGATVLLGTAVAALGITAPFSTVAIVTVMVGAPIAGAVVSHCKRGFGRTWWGCFMNELTRFTVQYEFSEVKSVGELSPGDHVVIPSWMFHPRCHVIVVKVLKKENQFVVIRFKHGEGVVEEIIKFCTPCCKVMHKIKPFTPEEIIERGKGQMDTNGHHVYHILNNNCKSFANWCVLDVQPKSVFSKLNYCY